MDAILDAIWKCLVPLVLILGVLGFLAIIVIIGVLFVFIGHLILKKTIHNGYDESILQTLKLSAIGASLMAIPLAFLLRYLTPSGSDGCSAFCKCFNQLLVSTLYGAVTGWVGGSIWRRAGHSGLSGNAAARAGCLGAVVLGPFVVIGALLAFNIIPRQRHPERYR